MEKAMAARATTAPVRVEVEAPPDAVATASNGATAGAGAGAGPGAATSVTPDLVVSTVVTAARPLLLNAVTRAPEVEAVLILVIAASPLEMESTSTVNSTVMPAPAWSRWRPAAATSVTLTILTLSTATPTVSAMPLVNAVFSTAVNVAAVYPPRAMVTAATFVGAAGSTGVTGVTGAGVFAGGGPGAMAGMGRAHSYGVMDSLCEMIHSQSSAVVPADMVQLPPLGLAGTLRAMNESSVAIVSLHAVNESPGSAPMYPMMSSTLAPSGMLEEDAGTLAAQASA
mmetsp:Transcript_24971/g.61537  ORF Transcript_24971/g.61537 Transcript_24971/m.61537 type:complete len:284 (-) Transcript_24971:847-1698(-)